MASVQEHYDGLLAEHYTWLYGGAEAMIARNREFFREHGIARQGGGVVVDLGAGSGFQSVPLAELGYRVIALDLSEKLLAELTRRCEGLPVTPVHDDLRRFADHCPATVDLVVCMGDTLTHLDRLLDVEQLLRAIHDRLTDGGKVIFTFRDLTGRLEGLDRFIPVRSDDRTVFTCFIEDQGDHAMIHDLIYVREADRWVLRKSCYRKLHIAVDWLSERMKNLGFAVDVADRTAGLVTVIAPKIAACPNTAHT